MDSNETRPNYPAYVKTIIEQRDEAQAELTGMRDMLNDLQCYLLSEKFHNDTTVQVRDILHRLQCR